MLSGSGEGKEDKKKEVQPELREWTIQHFQWQLKDEKAIRAWKEGDEGPIPKDATELANISLYKKDNEKSVGIINLGKATCGAILNPGKDDEGSWTTVSFFYSSGQFGKGVPDSTRGRVISMTHKSLANEKPIRIGSSAHGIRQDRGPGYKSFTVTVTVVTVKKCDDKTALKAFSSYIDRFKPRK
jgi:hypothetical protein